MNKQLLPTTLSLLALFFLLTTPLAAGGERRLWEEGCALQTPQGLAPDRNCDGLNDLTSTCEERSLNTGTTSEERACGKLSTQPLLEPGERAGQGTIFTLPVQLSAEEQAENVQVRVQNNALQIDALEHVGTLAPGEKKRISFTLKVPACAEPGAHELTFTTHYEVNGREASERNYQELIVTERRGACDAARSTIERTLLETLLQQELLPGEQTVYPIRLTNQNEEEKGYRLTLQGVTQLGTYRIDPSPEVTIPAGESRTVYLHLQTEPTAPPGRHKLKLLLESDGAMDEAVLKLRIIPAGAEEKRSITRVLLTLLAVLLLILLLSTLLIAYQRLKPREEKKEESGKKKKSGEGVEPLPPDDEEFKSYY